MRLVYLSDSFFARYGCFPEILQKRDRPYACLEIEIDGLLFAVPFRHHIRHRHAFFTVGEAGIDYTKAVVIEKPDYISADHATINSAEWSRIKGRESVIVNGMRRYYRLYLNAAAHHENPAYESIRRCSALQYFPSVSHKENDFSSARKNPYIR